MRLLLASYLVKHARGVANLRPEDIAGHGIAVGDHAGNPPPDYAIGWGNRIYGCRGAVMETGFFWNGCHLDTVDLYTNCSLNTPEGVAAVEAYRPAKSAEQIIAESALPASKYMQPSTNITWDGVVLACQNPGDRSILRSGSPDDYWTFLEGACEFYRHNLFIKLHPWNRNEIEARKREMAKAHGCSIGHVGTSVLEKCKFVLTFNSTFAVDCWTRRVRVAQFAPGYFWQTPGVFYTAGGYPVDIPDRRDAGTKLADFIINKYVTSCSLPTSAWIELFTHFAKSTALFPLPEDYAYSHTYAWAGKPARGRIMVPEGYRISSTPPGPVRRP